MKFALYEFLNGRYTNEQEPDFAGKLSPEGSK
jgi:hypothetical protein